MRTCEYFECSSVLSPSCPVDGFYCSRSYGWGCRVAGSGSVSCRDCLHTEGKIRFNCAYYRNCLNGVGRCV